MTQSTPTSSTAEIKALTTLLQSLWKGGGVIQAGLSNPAAAIELSRRGARVLGVDSDPAVVDKAIAQNLAAKGSARFECQVRDAWTGGVRLAADVVYLETLPTGGAATLALEAAFSKAHCVVLSEKHASSLPDRFAVLRQATASDELSASRDFCVLTDSRQPATATLASLAVYADTSAATLGDRSTCVAMELAASRCLAAGPARKTGMTLDPGMRPTGMDASVVAHRDLDGPAPIVMTTTRTDRFSREHVAILRAFEQVWVPAAGIRDTAIRCGLDAGRVHVVPTPVDTDRFRPMTRNDEGLRVLAMVSSRNRVAEGLLAARAFAEELGSKEDCHLTIVCGPDVDLTAFEKSLHEALTKGRGCARARVECVSLESGTSAETLYPQFDLLLRPCAGEKRGVAILESMACGVPVATTRFGLGAELVNIDNGYPIEIDGLEPCDPAGGDCELDEAGHLRPVPNFDSIRQCLRQAYASHAGLAARGDRARSDVVLRHSLQAVARTIQGIPNPPRALDYGTAPEVERGAKKTTFAEWKKEFAAPVAFALGESMPLTKEVLSSVAEKAELWCESPIAAHNWITAGLTPSKIQMVPPAIRCDLFEPNQRPAEVPTRKRLRILTYANLGLTSGADLAVRVFAEARISRAALLIAGADAETNVSLTRLASALDPSMEVAFVAEPTGEEDRASLVNACDLFLDFSRSGSNGRAVLEAAACVKPSLACSLGLPRASFDSSMGYPVAAKVKMDLVSQESQGQRTPGSIFLEVLVAEAAATLRRACEDTAGREQKGLTGRARALSFQPANLEAWVASRRVELVNSVKPRALSVAVVVPGGTEICQMDPGATLYELEGDRARGGLAIEASETIVNLTEDFVVLASGPLMAEPRWIGKVTEPLVNSQSVALALAKDDHGAILVLRPSLLRRHTFPMGFTSMAFMVDFARQVIQSGETVAPIVHVKLAFDPVTPVFTVESAAVSALATAHEAFGCGELETGLDALQTAMTAQPRYKAALETTAEFMASASAPSEERSALTALVKLDPRDAFARARLGRVLNQLGDTRTALTQMAVAHALAPEDASIATLFGQTLQRQGRCEEATDMFLNALAASPEHVDAAIGAADALSSLGQSSAALDLLRAFDTADESQLLTTVAR